MSDRILVLGDDVSAFLAVVRSLGRRGLEVHVAPSSGASAALHCRYISKVHSLPAYAGNPQQWSGALERLIDDHRITMVIPTSDSSLGKLYDQAQRPGKALFVTPNARAMEVFSDKPSTRALAETVGVPVAAGEMLSGDADAELLIARLGLPMVLKPRASYTLGDSVEKQTARIIRSEPELQSAILSPTLSGSFMEAFFTGEGVGLSVIARRGQILFAYQHRRLAEVSDTGPSTSRISEKVDPALLGHVAALAKAAELSGVAMFEFRVDRRRGDHILLEVNPRFWGSLPLALSAGADFPAMLYDLLTDGDVKPAAHYRVGVVKRDLTGEYYRLVRAAEKGSALRAGMSALANAARLLSPGAWDSWAADDPAPFVQDRKDLAALIGAAIEKRFSSPGSVFRRRRTA